MKIVKINGGLGNQLFQYIFARYIEEETGEKCILDDSDFHIFDSHNGYEIEKIFGIKANLLSDKFSDDVWNEMIKNVKNGKGICDQLLENGINICMIAETDDFDFNGNCIKVPTNEYLPEITQAQGNIYYHGYWINKKWLDKNKDLIIKELTFPDFKSEFNKKYAKQILNADSVAVHIRRGDFVKAGLDLPNEFYFNAIKSMSENYMDCTYFIFSDDIEWCKENYKDLGFDFTKGKIIFVIGNYDKENNYVDMQLMSMCKKMIMSVSSFCYLAELLNTNDNLAIVNPTGREV